MYRDKELIQGNSSCILSIVGSNISLLNEIDTANFSLHLNLGSNNDTNCTELNVNSFMVWNDLAVANTKVLCNSYDVLSFKEVQNSNWADCRVGKVNDLLKLPNTDENFKSSLKYINEAIELVPMRASHYYLRGKLYLKYCNPNQALKDYDIARKLDDSLNRSNFVTDQCMHDPPPELTLLNVSTRESKIDTASNADTVSLNVIRDQRTLSFLDRLYSNDDCLDSNKKRKHDYQHHHHKHKHKHHKHKK